MFLKRFDRKARNSMSKSIRGYAPSSAFLMPVAAQNVFFLALPAKLSAQSVPPALVSPPVGQPQTGSNGEKLVGMPKFHDPAPYDINEQTGYKQWKSLSAGRGTARQQPCSAAQ